MKNTIASLIICILTLFSYNAFSQGFHSVFSRDGNIVWAVGNNGQVFNSNSGGSTWNTNILGSTKYYSVFSVNQKVWITGENGVLQMSSNGGISWTVNTISSQQLNSVFFTDENNGWIAGNSGTILRTTNGGLNWAIQSSPVSVDLNCIRFLNTSNGVACGTGGKVIYWNGSAWNAYTTPVTNNLLSIDKKSSVIIATSADGSVIKSTNDGSSWNVIDYKIETKSEVNSVYMLDANTYYTCGGGGFIRKTTDGGATFTFQQNPMMGNLVEINFFDANKGWAVSSKNNAVLWTTNGGNTWSLPVGTNVSFSWSLKQSGSGNIGHGFCLHPFNKKTIFIAMGNKVYRSLDIGETWNQISTITPGTRAHTFFVSSVDSNYWIASMDESAGRVLRTTDYGTTWSVVWGIGALTSYGMPLMADQTTPNQVYLNPDNSVLLRSTNWGLNWSPAGTQVFRSPDNITVAWENPNVIYSGDGVTGSGVAELFKTTNGGINWTLIHTVSGSEIPFTVVTKLDPNLSYHTCWSSGGIFKSSLMWNSYAQVATTSNAWAVDISKDDYTAVAYGVYSSSVYISTNSGTNFVQSNVGSSPEAGMLFYDRGTLLSQKGGGVYKLAVTYDVPTAVNLISSEIPERFHLSRNYPNPFNPTTKFRVHVAKLSNVKIIVFDILGKEIAQILDRVAAPGIYDINFDGTNYGDGVYFYRLIADNYVETRKMILLK
ncbi:MAG: T9SS type A sorting domain-containing protein [Ignavibacteria bacterium]|nr:T9SS type A sorting domain-containing protein [Ignavibacteria bacterium]